MNIGPLKIDTSITIGTITTVMAAASMLYGVGTYMQKQSDQITTLTASVARLEVFVADTATQLRDEQHRMSDDSRASLAAESARREQYEATQRARFERMERSLDALMSHRKTERDQEPPERRG